MFIIGDVLVDRSVPSAHFHCDLESCKGACCSLEGGRGAPLEEHEVHEIEKAFAVVREYLSPDHLDTIERNGLYEGRPGDRATTCVNERACVFVYDDAGIARCSLERAFLEGRTSWRKPLSCHLFPIRIRRFGRDVLRYEQIEECASGRKRGKAEGIPLSAFLREPLVRKYGERWYGRLMDMPDTDELNPGNDC
jgi:hypothetical protein